MIRRSGQQAGVTMLPLWRPLTHAKRDTSINRLSSDKAFNVRAELGEIFCACCRMVTIQRTINNGLRQVWIKFPRGAASHQYARITLGAEVPSIGVPQGTPSRIRRANGNQRPSRCCQCRPRRVQDFNVWVCGFVTHPECHFVTQHRRTSCLEYAGTTRCELPR